MNFIKRTLAKIWDGILLSIGAVLSISLFYGGSAYYENMNLEEKVIDDKIEIIKHREVIRQDRAIILGSAKNILEEKISGFSIQVDLLNQDGEFVEQCVEYVRGLDAGKEVNFKVKCPKDCDLNRTVAHDSYKIYVTGI